MRDKEAGILGGVCAGLGHFFGINPNFLRIGIFLLVWFGVKYSVSLYILLWVAIPKAKSFEDKTLMKKGKLLSADEANTLSSKPYTSQYDKTPQGSLEISEQLQPIVSRMINFIAKGMATMYGLGLFFLLIITLVAISAGFFIWKEYLQQMAFLLGIDFGSVQLKLFLGLGIPLFLLFIALIWLVFNKNYFRAYYVFPLIGVWLISLILLYTDGYKIYSDFRESGITNEVFELNDFSSDTLFVGMLDTNVEPIFSNDGKFIFDYEKVLSIKDSLYTDFILFDVKKSKDDIFRLSVDKKAFGKQRDEAVSRASQIDYSLKSDHDHLLLNKYLGIQKNAKWRFQSIRLVVEIPNGKFVHLGRKMRTVLANNDSEKSIASVSMLDKVLQMTNGKLVAPK